MASAKLTLLLELKDRLFNSKLKKVSGKIDALKIKHAQAFSAMKQELPMLGKGMDLITNKYVLMGAGIVAIGMLAISATKKAAEFNNEFLQIKQMNLGKPKAEMDKYKNSIKNAAFEVGTNLNDSTRAFYDLQSGTGLFGKAAVDVFKKVGNYSVATGANLNETMTATVKAMKAMGLGVKDIDGYLISNAKTVQTGITTYAELASVQTEYLGAAASAGQNVDIANKIFAGFTSIAKNSDVGANMTKTFFQGLTENAAKIGKELDIDLYKNGKMLGADKIIEQISIKFKGMTQEAQHAAITAIGGPEGLKGMLQKVGTNAEDLLNTFKTFDASKFDLSQALANAHGDVTVLGDIVKNRWNTVLAAMGEKLLPVVAKGLNIVNNIIQFAWNNWGVLGPILGSIAAGFVGIKIASYAAGNGITFMGKAILGIPVLGWILALAAAIYSLIEATEGWSAQWENLKKLFPLMWEGMKLSFTVMIQSMGNSFMDFFDGIEKGYLKIKNLLGDISDREYKKNIAKITIDRANRDRDLALNKGRLLRNKELSEKTAEWKIKWKSDESSKSDILNDEDLAIDGIKANGNLNQTLGNQVTEVTGAAAQVRNITINIDALNKGGINTQNTTLAKMSADEIANWFNETMLRVVRNVELSMA